jgi:preprotein translocase subunit SecA
MASLYAEAADFEPSDLDRWVLGYWVPIVGRLRASRQSLMRIARSAVHHEAEARRASLDELRRMLKATSEPAQALAALRELGVRTLGLRAHDVQLLGVLGLQAGKLLEMNTGEGKSLTAALAATLVAKGSTPVHVITVNDYLAQRDAERFQPLFEAVGLTVSSVTQALKGAARAEAYRSDIVYTTNKDVAFDYLRDRVEGRERQGAAQSALRRWLSPAAENSATTLRGLHFAILDEADSLLIDEAKTPLILSQQPEGQADATAYSTALDDARALVPGLHFAADALGTHHALRAAGQHFLTERCTTRQGIWKSAEAREFIVLQALKALYGLARDKDYIVREDKIEIVDPATGRVMPDRSWERGLHQLVQVKEGVGVTFETQTLARITFQRFFARYCRLSGMTGTALEAAKEIAQVYGLSVLRVPPHQPSRRFALPARLHQDQDAKWADVVRETMTMSATGRPVLVGTQSIAQSQHLASLLEREGAKPRVLNASQDSQEAQIIERAGAQGAITVATNMAGRGTDIALDDRARKAGGLHVVLTAFHDSARIDRQLFGRAARQGDPGSVRAIVALDDPLWLQHCAVWARSVAAGLARVGLGNLATSVLRSWSQRRCERRDRALRAQVRRADTEQRRKLAFSGEAE